MTEGLFVLTTIFVAYVVYVVVNDRKKSAKSPLREAQSAKTVSHAAPPKAEAAAKKEAPQAPKPAVTESPAAVSAESATKTGLRDPKTGEVATAFTNYRFTKRWIKEALVEEGLLDKIYKNNELDPDVEAKIKSAVAKLETMDKYRA
ncbi:MAG: hypothetical protein ACU84H_09655 [Gammaproteobacteria bacterium]